MPTMPMRKKKRKRKKTNGSKERAAGLARPLVRDFDMIRPIAAALVILGLLGACCVPLAAQKKAEQTRVRSVQGAVTSASGDAVTGAVVQLKNTKTLQIRSFITKEQGEYFFNGLSPDVDFELRAEFNNTSSSTKTLSSFDGRKQAVLNLKLDK